MIAMMTEPTNACKKSIYIISAAHRIATAIPHKAVSIVFDAVNDAIPKKPKIIISKIVKKVVMVVPTSPVVVDGCRLLVPMHRLCRIQTL
ncbi:hypothetical protein LCGC14_1069250 [marine sediment metagenome]|uniref:Uncharacterized protein n=1 Tax=marine sediment metagenome TaxID=412755 RepID=A0A0F9QPI4_9ZZZZ